MLAAPTTGGAPSVVARLDVQLWEFGLGLAGGSLLVGDDVELETAPDEVLYTPAVLRYRLE